MLTRRGYAIEGLLTLGFLIMALLVRFNFGEPLGLLKMHYFCDLLWFALANDVTIPAWCYGYEGIRISIGFAGYNELGLFLFRCAAGYLMVIVIAIDDYVPWYSCLYFRIYLAASSRRLVRIQCQALFRFGPCLRRRKKFTQEMQIFVLEHAHRIVKDILLLADNNSKRCSERAACS
jgi:hypothetical protein